MIDNSYHDNIGNDDVVGFVDPKKVSFEEDELAVGDNLNQYTEINNDDYTCLTTSSSSSEKIDPSEQNILERKNSGKEEYDSESKEIYENAKPKKIKQKSITIITMDDFAEANSKSSNSVKEKPEATMPYPKVEFIGKELKYLSGNSPLVRDHKESIKEKDDNPTLEENPPIKEIEVKLVSPEVEASTQSTQTSNDIQEEDQKPASDGKQDGEKLHESLNVAEGKTNNVNVRLRGANPTRAHNLHVDDVHKKCIIDNGADTTVIGKGWKVVGQTTRKANVIGFDTKVAVKRNLPIVTAVAAVDLKNNETILVGVHEGVFNESAPHSLLSDFQLRECVESLDAISKRHDGKQTLKPSEEITIPLRMTECMMTFQNRQPTEKEINTHEVHWLTLNKIWDPKKHFDDPEDEFFNCSEDEEETMALKVHQENPEDQDNEFHDCMDKMPERELFGKAVHLDIDASRGIFVRSAELDHLLNLIPTNDLIPKDEIMTPKESNVNFFGQLPDTEMQPEVSQKLHQARPAKIDCEKLVPNFAFMGSDIIRETMKRTTQMATATFCFPMRRHLKSMFKQLRRRRLNEVIATDTHFSKVKSIEGHWCSQVFHGCTSKTINIGGMKTESEFPHVCQDFLGEHGIPHTLRRDNAKSEQHQKQSRRSTENSSSKMNSLNHTNPNRTQQKVVPSSF